jgi:tetratricopeptide (TPR) repeat protein
MRSRTAPPSRVNVLYKQRPLKGRKTGQDRVTEPNFAMDSLSIADRRHAEYFSVLLSALADSYSREGEDATQVVLRFRCEWPQIELAQRRAASLLPDSCKLEAARICVSYALALCDSNLSEHGVRVDTQLSWIRDGLGSIHLLHDGNDKRRRLLFELGQRLNTIGEYSGAVESLEECLAIPAASEEPMPAAVVGQLSDGLVGLGDRRGALAILHAAMEKARIQDDIGALLIVSMHLVRDLVVFEDLSECARIFEDARGFFRRHGDLASEAHLLTSMGQWAPHLLGANELYERYAREFMIWMRSESHARSIDGRKRSGGERNRPGPMGLQVSVSLFQALGAFGAALEVVDESLRQARRDEDLVAELRSLLLAGEIVKIAQNGGATKTLYERALQLSRILEDHASEAEILTELADLDERGQRFASGLEHRRLASASGRGTRKMFSEFANLMESARDTLTLRNYPHTIAFYKQALAVAERQDSPSNQFEVLSALGTLFAYLKQYEEAASYLERALDCHHRIASSEPPPDDRHVLRILGTTWFFRGRYAAAARYLEQSIARDHASPAFLHGGVEPILTRVFLVKASWEMKRRMTAVTHVFGAVRACAASLTAALYRPLARAVQFHRGGQLFARWYHVQVPGSATGKLVMRPALWVFGLLALLSTYFTWMAVVSPLSEGWPSAVFATDLVGIAISMWKDSSRLNRVIGPMIAFSMAAAGLYLAIVMKAWLMYLLVGQAIFYLFTLRNQFRRE